MPPHILSPLNRVYGREIEELVHQGVYHVDSRLPHNLYTDPASCIYAAEHPVKLPDG